MEIEYRITTHGTCDTIEALQKDAEILTIDGRACFGRCEACGKPILAEDAEKGIPADVYRCDYEGIYLCGPYLDDCMAAYENEHHPQEFVTHEMALDAGDPSLEGQPI